MSTTGDVEQATDSKLRMATIALVHALDRDKVQDAFEAISQIGFAESLEEPVLPETHGQTFSFAIAGAGTEILPVEIEDE